MCLKWVFRSFRCGSIVCENRNNGEGYVKNWHAYRGRVGVNRNGRFSAAPGRGWRVVNFGRSSRTSSEKSLRRIWKPYDFPTLIAVIRVCQTKRRNVPPNAPQKTAKIKRTNQRPGKHYTGIDRRSRYIYIYVPSIYVICVVTATEPTLRVSVSAVTEAGGYRAGVLFRIENHILLATLKAYCVQKSYASGLQRPR